MSNWQTKKLGDLADIIKAIGLSKKDISDDGKYEAILYGELFRQYAEKIKVILNRTNKTMSVSKTVYGDVLMPTSDVTPTGLATGSCVQKSGVLLGGDILIIRPKDEMLGMFFAYFIASNKKCILRITTGTTIFHLYASDLKKLEVLIPDLAEQERIVGVLEVWDNYLEKLERKIQLKEQSKLFLSYAIFNQEISEGITQMKIKDLCMIRTGKKDVNQGNPDGVYPFFTCSREHTYSDDFSYDCEAILVAGNADVGHCKYYRGKFEAYQRTYILSDFKNIDGKYLFYVMDFYFKRAIESKKQSGAMSYIKLPMLQNFLVNVPNLNIQKEIVSKFDDMNNEIATLKSKKHQIQQQKKFLLKNLVSGTIRTPEDILEKSSVCF